MIYDRPYMRDSFAGQQRPWLWWSLWLIAGIFVLERVASLWFGAPSLLYRGDNIGTPVWLRGALALSWEHLREGRVWTLLSYGVLHGDAWHLLMNVLFTWMFGRFLVDCWGQAQTALLFWVGVLVGAFAFLGVQAIGGDFGPRLLIGASAGASAVFIGFCCRLPEEMLQLLLLPIQLKVKHVAWIFLGFNAIGLLMTELPDALGSPGATAMVAFSAHLGGALAGWLFERYREKIFSVSGGISIEAPGWLRKKKKVPAANYQVNVGHETPPDLDKDTEINRILDKINEKGLHSITKAERRLLEEYGGTRSR